MAQRGRIVAPFPEPDPHWQWTEGLRHLVDCVESGRPTITRPEHAYHALEVMLAAQAAGRDGVAREIESDFPIRSTRRSGSSRSTTATPTTAAATMGYKPSPRPSFDAPTVLRADEVVRHTWGDAEAGFVEDWIYVSSQLIHTIVFGMPPGGRFTHSESFRTIFGADELLHVLQGILVLANPETGEIVRAEPGESVFFRRDTWHHGFSYGDEALRVLEFFAPPPATGTSGPYAQAQPYLDVSRYADDRILGNLLATGRSELCVDSTQSPTARSALVHRPPPPGRGAAARHRRARGPPRELRAPHGRHRDRERGPGEPGGVARRRGAPLRDAR